MKYLFILFQTLVFSQTGKIILDGDLEPLKSQSQYEIISQLKGLNSERAISSSLKMLKNYSFANSNDNLNTRAISGGDKLFDNNAPAVPLILSEEGIGSGALIASNGEIITNWHVINNAEDIYVVLFNEEYSSIDDIDRDKIVDASIIAADPKRDLALIKINKGLKLPVLKFASEYGIKISNEVFAIGHPKGLIWSFTDGIISRIRNNYKWTYDELEMKAKVIQTQTPINPGNSGGPLFNKRGELIGINSFGQGESQGLNFAIHVSEVMNFYNDAKKGQFKPVDYNKTKKSTFDEFDTNKNQIVDTYCTSTNNTGQYDMCKEDKDEDGNIERITIDVNLDSKIDTIVLDQDNDGFFESWFYDSDYDGEFDHSGLDEDRNGVPDSLNPITN